MADSEALERRAAIMEAPQAGLSCDLAYDMLQEARQEFILMQR